MPSSHAQVMAYAFTTALVMHSHRRRNRKNSNSNVAKTEFFEFIELVSLAVLLILVCIARVYLGYHGVDQVVAGAALGSVFSAIWFLGVIKAVHATGLAKLLQALFSPLLYLGNAWEEGWVHFSNVASKKVR
jgi:membrane-associated phospholipid phosphatase